MSPGWSAPLPPWLRPFVAGAVGYAVSGMPPGVHVGAPSGHLTLIVPLDAPIRVSDPGEDPRAYWGLVSGLQPVPGTVHHDGTMEGIQLDLTPYGARALLGVPAAEVSGTASLDDYLLPEDRGLAERVAAEPGWPERMQVVVAALTRRFDRSEPVAPAAEVTEAWRLLHRSAGRASVAEVADHVGWSRRHLGQRFRAETGVTPKSLARVARFQRSRTQVLGGRPLAEVAARCGYADQAHLTREWRDLCGVPPTTWLGLDHLAVATGERED